MDIIKTLHLIILLRFCWSEKSLTAKTYLSIVRTGPCRIRKATELLTVSEMSVYQESESLKTISGWLYVSQDIENGWSVKAIMQKCHDIRNLDTCDFFKSDTIVRNGCFDSWTTEAYYIMFQYLTPKISCPIRAGNYTLRNFPYITNNLTSTDSKISTSVFGYTYSNMGFNEEEERIFCIESHLRLNHNRNHDWTAGINKLDPTPAPSSIEENNKEENLEIIEIGTDDD